jgi:hypothetical protein
MRLPANLYNSYRDMKSSRLNRYRKTDNDSLKFFENLLNAAQPQTPEDMAQRQLIRGLHHKARRGFLDLLVDEFEAYKLWIDFKTIVADFKLEGIVYIQWDRETSKYTVSKYDNERNKNNSNNSNHTHPIAQRRKHRKGRRAPSQSNDTYASKTIMKHPARAPLTSYNTRMAHILGPTSNSKPDQVDPLNQVSQVDPITEVVLDISDSEPDLISPPSETSDIGYIDDTNLVEPFSLIQPVDQDAVNDAAAAAALDSVIFKPGVPREKISWADMGSSDEDG